MKDDIHNSVDSAAISLPHRPEARLASQIPAALVSSCHAHRLIFLLSEQTGGELLQKTDHFSVTWPFCTRLVLKPMVGIELSKDTKGERVSKRTIFATAIHTSPESRLTTHSTVNSPP